jgi:hypothetical protein
VRYLYTSQDINYNLDKYVLSLLEGTSLMMDIHILFHLLLFLFRKQGVDNLV